MSVVHRAIPWFVQDPLRLQRDKYEVALWAPELAFVAPSVDSPQGGWKGLIPVWPFERARPECLESWLPGGGLQIELQYTAAYPMVPPHIVPIAPEPELLERSQAVWHVLPDGGLCLLQSAGQWQPEASVTELLMKAAGWRLEYALMKHGTIDRMSENGLVSDSRYDDIFRAEPA